MFRVVAAKVARVNYDATNDSGQAQTNDAPVEAGRTSPPALPPIHPLATVGVLAFDEDGRARLQQILLRREEIVVGVEHGPAQTLGGEVNLFGEIHVVVKQLRDLAGGDPNDPGFAPLLNAMKYGIPPHGGFGLGLERLTQKLLGFHNVKEATLFPRDINRLGP